MEDKQTVSYFDRAIGQLNDLPDVVKSKASTQRVIPVFGIGSNVYIVQTYRQREQGDTIFLEHVADNGTVRIVIPPAIADTIARQRDQLTAKTRRLAGKRNAEERKRLGMLPGFMQAKRGKNG